MTLPLISICIPTYNGERFIEETVKSVLNQSYENFELLICDDSSSDETVALIRSIPDPRIRIIVNETNLRAEGNWNKVTSEAIGEYTKIMGQDDILLPKCLEVEVAALQLNQDASFCWSKRDIISPRGRRLIRSRGMKLPAGKYSFEEKISSVIESGTNTIGEPCAVLMRTSFLRKAGGFRGQYIIDLDMWFRLWELSPAVFTSATVCQFRISNQSWTTALQGSQAVQVIELFAAMKAKYPTLLNSVEITESTKSARKLEIMRAIITRFVEVLRI